MQESGRKHGSHEEEKVLEDLDRSAAAETAMAREFGELVGKLDKHQKSLFLKADQLIACLDGVDDDRASDYGRAFPSRLLAGKPASGK